MADRSAVLEYSGGKDSTALLYLARPYLDRITVLFADTGGTYPHVKDHVAETCIRLGANLQIVQPRENVFAYTERVGLPADIVPIEALAEMAPMMKERPSEPLQSYLQCCSAMLWEPLQEAVRESGATLVLRGSKRADGRVGVADGHSENGVTYSSPLWDWTDSDVMAYLEREGVELPAHYAAVRDSLDCIGCPAHLAHHGAAKLAWMRRAYPDLYALTAARINRVRAALLAHVERISPALEEIKR